MNGIDSLSNSDIDHLAEKYKYILPDLQKFAFMEREESMEDFARRFVQLYNAMREQGVHQHLAEPKAVMMDFGRYNLDYGLVYLHKFAF